MSTTSMSTPRMSPSTLFSMLFVCSVAPLMVASVSSSLASYYLPYPSARLISSGFATWLSVSSVLYSASRFVVLAAGNDLVLESCLILYAVGYMTCLPMVFLVDSGLFAFAVVLMMFFRSNFPIMQANEEVRRRFVARVDSLLIQEKWREPPQRPHVETPQQEKAEDEKTEDEKPAVTPHET